jgi:hypothetical protein
MTDADEEILHKLKFSWRVSYFMGHQDMSHVTEGVVDSLTNDFEWMTKKPFRPMDQLAIAMEISHERE